MSKDNPHGYFAWQRRKFHRQGEMEYSPIWSSNPPTTRSADGTKTKYVGIVPLTEEQQKKSLFDLARMFPLPITVEIIPPM